MSFGRPPRNDLLWAIIAATRIALPAFIGYYVTYVAMTIGIILGLVLGSWVR